MYLVLETNVVYFVLDLCFFTEPNRELPEEDSELDLELPEDDIEPNRELLEDDSEPDWELLVDDIELDRELLEDNTEPDWELAEDETELDLELGEDDRELPEDDIDPDLEIWDFRKPGVRDCDVFLFFWVLSGEESLNSSTPTAIFSAFFVLHPSAFCFISMPKLDFSFIKSEDKSAEFASLQSRPVFLGASTWALLRPSSVTTILSTAAAVVSTSLYNPRSRSPASISLRLAPSRKSFFLLAVVSTHRASSPFSLVSPAFNQSFGRSQFEAPVDRAAFSTRWGISILLYRTTSGSREKQYLSGQIFGWLWSNTRFLASSPFPIRDAETSNAFLLTQKRGKITGAKEVVKQEWFEGTRECERPICH